jgi:hypothetical protein
MIAGLLLMPETPPAPAPSGLVLLLLLVFLLLLVLFALCVVMVLEPFSSIRNPWVLVSTGIAPSSSSHV